MLDEIIRHKKEVLEKIRPFREAYIKSFRFKIESVVKPPLDFASALAPGGAHNEIRIIAEVKKASPSKGVIRENFYPVEIAKAYASNGAAAISILTDEKYFQGKLDFLTSIKANVRIPLLRKDFIVDEFQVFESRAAGADAILLIVAALDRENLERLITVASDLGMACLVEVHDETELKTAIEAGAKIIGINNRDLKTFKTDKTATKRLAPLVPEGVITVSESGINTFDDVLELKEAGAQAFLVGEALMREKDVGKKLRELRGLIDVKPPTPEELAEMEKNLPKKKGVLNWFSKKKKLG